MNYISRTGKSQIDTLSYFPLHFFSMMIPVGIVPSPLLWAGLIATLLLWPYLLYKYRRAGSVRGIGAVPAESGTPEVFKPIQSSVPKTGESAKTSVPTPAAAVPQPVTIAPKPSIAKTVAQVAPKAGAPTSAQAVTPAPSQAAAPAQAPAPTQAPAPAPIQAQSVIKKTAPTATPASGATTTGGISPAVVYLQNLKGEMDTLKKDVDGMKVMLSTIAQKSEAQLNAVLQRLESMQARERQAAPEEARPKVKPEPNPAPKMEEKEIFEPAPQVTVSESTVTLPGPEVKVQPAAAEPAPEPAPAPVPEPEPPSSDPPRRRGPVWPV